MNKALQVQHPPALSIQSLRFRYEAENGDASTLAEDLRSAHFPDQQWLFFRTTPKTFEHLRFAHGSCRKWAGESEQPRDTGPDMLDALGRLWLGSKRWSEWPQFFLHTGDQIYADDVSLHMAGSILRHRVATVVPGPAPAETHDVAFGAWAGRFGFRYGPSVPPPPPSDLDQLHKLRPRVDDDFSTHDIDYAMKLAERARKQKDLSQDELRTVWDAQLTKAERASLHQLAKGLERSVMNERSIGVGEAVQWAEEHLFDRSSVVLECQVWQEALGRARGETFAVSELKEFTNQRGYIRDEAHPGAVTLREVLLRECEIVQTAKEGVGDCWPSGCQPAWATSGGYASPFRTAMTAARESPAVGPLATTIVANCPRLP
jgi:hypothetical protein